MVKQFYLFFFIVLCSIIYSCSNTVSHEQSVGSDSDTENYFNPYEEDFEPIISMDSLIKIEEELNEKLEGFEKSEHSK